MDPKSDTRAHLSALLQPHGIPNNAALCDRLQQDLGDAAPHVHPASVLLHATTVAREPLTGQDRSGEVSWSVHGHSEHRDRVHVEVEVAAQRDRFEASAPFSGQSIAREWHAADPMEGTAVYEFVFEQMERPSRLAMFEDIAQGADTCVRTLDAVCAMARSPEALRFFHDAIVRGDEDAALDAMALGVPINAVDGVGNTAMHLAARHGRLGLIRPLIRAGALIDEPNATGQSALHLAAAAGHAMVCAELMVHGADLERRDVRGRTPLDCAGGKLRERGHAASL